jgi:hypothetical protein
MALTIVNSVGLRPDRMGPFQDQVGRLADTAADKGDPWRWTAHQTLFGQTLVMHFVTQVENFADVDQLGTVEQLWTRVLGEKKGQEGFRDTNECVQTVQQTISTLRPELSHLPDDLQPGAHPAAVITEVRARPGQAEACEELIRKIAEAIPKTGDAARIITNQSLIGDLNLYWTVRPLSSLADLDAQLPAPELLNQAFGPAEGGLLWRTGSEAVEQARREIVGYLPELSNTPQN